MVHCMFSWVLMTLFVCTSSHQSLPTWGMPSSHPTPSPGGDVLRLNLSVVGEAISSGQMPVLVNKVLCVLSSVELVAYSAIPPMKQLWSFAIEPDFCCPNSTGIANSSSDSSASSSGSGSSWLLVPEALALASGDVVLTCGVSTAVFDGTTGTLRTTFQAPNNNFVRQITSIGTALAMRTFPDPNVTVYNTSTWRPYWSIHYANASIPIVLDSGEGILAVIRFFSDFSAVAEGYDAQGAVKWTVAMDMFASSTIASVPQYSKSVIAWFGPNFALVRLLYMPTGAHWQYVPDFVVIFMLPADNGIVAISSRYVITALDAANQVVLWSVTVPFWINDFAISPDGEYVMAWPTDPTQSNAVFGLRDGSTLFSCGPSQCARPCVVRVPPWNATLVARCGPNHTEVVLLTLHDSTSGAVVSNSVHLPNFTSAYPVSLTSIAPSLVSVCDLNTGSMALLYTSPHYMDTSPPSTTPLPDQAQLVVVVVSVSAMATALCAAALNWMRHRVRTQLTRPLPDGPIDGLRTAFTT